MSAVRTGPATQWEDPYPEKGKCKVGGRAVWVYRFKKDTEDEINPNYELLKKAAVSGAHVHCEGGERDVRNERGSFTTFTAYDVRIQESALGNGAGNGEKGKALAPGPIPGVARASDFFADERQRTISAQWATNAAIALGDPKLQGIPEALLRLPLDEKAKYLLALAHDLAKPEGARPPIEEPPKEQPSADDDRW